MILSLPCGIREPSDEHDQPAGTSLFVGPPRRLGRQTSASTQGDWCLQGGFSAECSLARVSGAFTAGGGERHATSVLAGCVLGGVTVYPTPSMYRLQRSSMSKESQVFLDSEVPQRHSLLQVEEATKLVTDCLGPMSRSLLSAVHALADFAPGWYTRQEAQVCIS